MSLGSLPGCAAPAGSSPSGRPWLSLCRASSALIDLDLAAFFDSVRHDVLLAKVARRVQDVEILRLLKLILKASGSEGCLRAG